MPASAARQQGTVRSRGGLTGDVMVSESKTRPSEGSDSEGEELGSGRREKSAPKQKATMLDMVIKNTELIFTMLNKRL